MLRAKIVVNNETQEYVIRVPNESLNRIDVFNKKPFNYISLNYLAIETIGKQYAISCVTHNVRQN